MIPSLQVLISFLFVISVGCLFWTAFDFRKIKNRDKKELFKLICLLFIFCFTIFLFFSELSRGIFYLIEGEVPKVDVQEVIGEEGVVTRVDVVKVNEKGDYEDVVIITYPDKVDLIEKSLENAKWYPSIEAEMARKEDVVVLMFYSFDKNMPERIYRYRIWFEENDTTAIISNKESEYVELSKEATQNLKNALAN